MIEARGRKYPPPMHGASQRHGGEIASHVSWTHLATKGTPAILTTNSM